MYYIGTITVPSSSVKDNLNTATPFHLPGARRIVFVLPAGPLYYRLQPGSAAGVVVASTNDMSDGSNTVQLVPLPDTENVLSIRNPGGSSVNVKVYAAFGEMQSEVLSMQIEDGSVTTGKIAAAAVTGPKIAAGAQTSDFVNLTGVNGVGDVQCTVGDGTVVVGTIVDKISLLNAGTGATSDVAAVNFGATVTQTGKVLIKAGAGNLNGYVAIATLRSAT